MFLLGEARSRSRLAVTCSSVPPGVWNCGTMPQHVSNLNLRGMFVGRSAGKLEVPSSIHTNSNPMECFKKNDIIIQFKEIIKLRQKKRM